MTTTNRFQPGDKVRVRPASAAVLGFTTNSTHTVAHVDDFGRISLLAIVGYFHPSHFDLVERAVPDIGRYGHDADMPCYSLKDGEGDWWVYETEDPRSVGAWHLVAEPFVTREGTDEGVEEIADEYGIDAAETHYCLLDGEGDWWVYDAPSHLWLCVTLPAFSFEDGIEGFTDGIEEIARDYGIDAGKPALAALMAEPPVWAEEEEPWPDERIIAWRRLADHPIFKDCYAEERPLIEAMMAKLDRIYSEGYTGTDVEFGEPEPPTHDSLGRALAQMAEQLSIAGEAAGKAMGEFLRAVTDEREEDAA